MSFEDKQRAPVLSASFRTIIGLVMLLTISSAIFAHANSEAPNSVAYQEVIVPLDPETKAVGGALYAQHCAARHDGSMVRAPQRYVLAGSNEGWLRAFDIDNGEVLWEFDTTRSFTAVDGRLAQGGSIGGGQAPLIVGDRLIVNSGYAFAGKMPGNALLVLKLPASDAQVAAEFGAQVLVDTAAK